MMKIGLTGGIGAGKSLVASIFKVLGIPVYEADKKARGLMLKDRQLKQEIKNLLGDKSYFKNGRPDRKFIAGIVFADKQKLKALNALIHPAVKRDFLEWANNQNSPYVIEESALIYEIGNEKYFNRMIVVVARDDIRIKRVIERDEVTEEQVRRRMKQQWPQSKKQDQADFVIENNGDKSLIRQVMDIHFRLINLNK